MAAGGGDWLDGPVAGPVDGPVFAAPGLVRGAGGVRAVNVPASESDPAAVGEAELLLRLGGGAGGERAVAAADERQSRQEYGLPLVGLALLAVAAESGLAFYCGRREERDETA